MTEIKRVFQYRYLLNSMRSLDKIRLEQTRVRFEETGISIFDEDLVFRTSPLNKTFERISYDFWEKPEHKIYKEWKYYKVLWNFFILYSDQNCRCGDGQLYFSQIREKLCLSCDRCDRSFSFDGREIGNSGVRPANRHFFLREFYAANEDSWYKVSYLVSSRTNIFADAGSQGTF